MTIPRGKYILHVKYSIPCVFLYMTKNMDFTRLCMHNKNHDELMRLEKYPIRPLKGFVMQEVTALPSIHQKYDWR